MKVLRRQAPFVLPLAALLAPLALIIGLNQKDSFTSHTSAVYDNRDTSEPIPRFPYYPRFAQVADSFKTKVYDVEFLWQVAKDVGLTQVKSDESPFRTAVRRVLPQALEPWPQPKPRELPDDLTTKSYMAQYMRGKFAAYTDDKKNSLSLMATGDDPFEAKRLAEAAMELFIQSELRFEAEGVERQRDLDASFLREMTKGEAEAERKPAPVQPSTEEGRLADAEAELLDRLSAVKAELDQEKNHGSAVRAALEADLARLATKLQPSHPEVMAKQDELKALGKGDDQALRSRLAQLRQKLAEVRDQQRRLGFKVSAGEGRFDGIAKNKGSFLPTLSDRVSELTLEQSRIAKQAETPSMRTRIRVAVPATYDEMPTSASRRSTILGLGMLLGLLLLVVTALREYWSPLARDRWRVEGRVKTPILVELSRAGLQRYPSISPQLAGILRESVESNPERRNPASQILLAYRRLELEIRRHAKGPVVLLINASADNRSGAFIQNFLNVSATESAAGVLMIDCDYRDPVVPADERVHSVGDFPAFLQGKVAWKDVRLPRGPDRAFDLLPAPAQASEAPRAYRVDVLQKLFANLARSYSRIYLRGHDVRQVIDNEALVQAATDCFLVVDGRSTTFAEIERSLSFLNRDKLRGLILIGT